ncbi:hypothetical protein D8674_026185 [Pyrus ussuriensis x Pyrus communis]|uniref:Uncharacterized protein n=1 Tax=Pyrus ussuriensis x Pyrus communis TaxID=2448454 RepID=A0A5N5IAQ7_9ROSA|nr:hypothetical protein D8674_026185 [Pyrus ussuriensis x Pyrus communis]
MQGRNGLSNGQLAKAGTIRWSYPEAGFVKLNFDRSVINQQDASGFVIKNENGSLIIAWTRMCPEREYFPDYVQEHINMRNDSKRNWKNPYSEFYTPSLQKHLEHYFEQFNVPEELPVEDKLSKLFESIELYVEITNQGFLIQALNCGTSYDDREDYVETNGLGSVVQTELGSAKSHNSAPAKPVIIAEIRCCIRNSFGLISTTRGSIHSYIHPFISHMIQKEHRMRSSDTHSGDAEKTSMLMDPFHSLTLSHFIQNIITLKFWGGDPSSIENKT